jgi:pimeloyl-ACP methyl ester carboxylesterase
MQRLSPFFREAGAGPGVVCLHANASTSSQWRALLEAGADRFRIYAADAYGAGQSPPWPQNRTLSLNDEAALLEPLFALAGDRFALVGHSYGGAVALIAALSQPGRVRALALYEPTLFSLVDAETPPPNEAEGIRAVVLEAAEAVERGNTHRAGELFIDYWMGASAWRSMPESRRDAIAPVMVNVLDWGRALMHEPTPLSAFARLDIPVLYMMGRASPPSSRAVGRLLTSVLPRVEVIDFAGLGHMGPVTHPQIVNEAILRFLAAH